MNRSLVRIALAATAAGALSLSIAACGSGGDASAGAKQMSFKLTDAGCDPHDAKVPAGPIAFDVENAGSASVTEFEVLAGDTILGEVENLADGLSGSFSLTLDEGEYTLRCTGGSDEDGTLTVTAGAEAQTSPETGEAIAQYRDYLEQNTAELVATTAGPVARGGGVSGLTRPNTPPPVPPAGAAREKRLAETDASDRHGILCVL